MTLPNENCPNCSHTGRTHWDDRGEETCTECGWVDVINTTYESSYDPERTRDLGKPGRQVLDKAELRRFSMSPRLAVHQNQAEQVPMAELVKREIEASPFCGTTKEQALRIWRCTPAPFFSESRADTSVESYGLDTKYATHTEKLARREHRAECQAWAVLALVDEASPIGWRRTAQLNGLETEKCLAFAERIKKQLGYNDADGIRQRAMMTDILGLPRPTQRSLLRQELERLTIWFGNKNGLSGMSGHQQLMAVKLRAYGVLDAWGIPSMPVDLALGNKSPAQLAEMAFSIALLELGHAPEAVRAMFDAFPKGRMAEFRKRILDRTFSPWPSGSHGNSTSMYDDFSSHGGWEE